MIEFDEKVIKIAEVLKNLIKVYHAFNEIMDGLTTEDLRRMTGLPIEDCNRIVNTHREVLDWVTKNYDSGLKEN